MDPGLGKLLIGAGFILMVIGALFVISGHVPWLGKLPGDVVLKKGSFQFYFPIATSILISVILTILLNIFRK